MISAEGGWWESKAEEAGKLGAVAMAEASKDTQKRRYPKGAQRGNGSLEDDRKLARPRRGKEGRHEGRPYTMETKSTD
jgi:hypothetical protein